MNGRINVGADTDAGSSQKPRECGRWIVQGELRGNSAFLLALRIQTFPRGSRRHCPNIAQSFLRQVIGMESFKVQSDFTFIFLSWRGESAANQKLCNAELFLDTTRQSQREST